MMTPIKAVISPVKAVVLMGWFLAFAFAFAMYADGAMGVSRTELMAVIPLPFALMAMLGHTVSTALASQEQRIARLEAELGRQERPA